MLQGRQKDAEKYYGKAIELDRHNGVKIGEFNEHDGQIKFDGTINYDEKLFKVNDRKVKFSRLTKKITTKNLEEYIEKHITNRINRDALRISTETRIITLGSCFALNLSNALRKEGYYSTKNITFGEDVNSTFANNLLVKCIVNKQKLDKNLRISYNADATLKYLEGAEILIYTLGVAPCFFEAKTGRFFPGNGVRGMVRGENIYRNTTVEENVKNILEIIDIVRTINPKCKFVFSVSPVALSVTFLDKTAVEADCISKSILRVAIEQVVSLRKDCIYWPSFEIVRWLGVYFPGMYLLNGGMRNVSEEVVGIIIKDFIRIFGTTALTGNHS